MSAGNSLIGWVIGSIIVGSLWVGVRPIIEDGVGEGGWYLLTLFIVLADILALAVIIKESAG